MKNRILLAVVAATVAVIVLLAVRGSASITNQSGRSIEQVTISIDGNVVLEHPDLADGELLEIAFNSGATDNIEIELALGNGGTSRGTIAPGYFASIGATVNVDGDVDFGDTRFDHAQVKIGSW